MQEQIVGRLDAHLKQAYQSLEDLKQQASSGLQSMLASRPDDFTAFNSALGAITQQARTISGEVHGVWGNDLGGGLTGDAYYRGERMVREGTQWIDDEWGRFEAHWRMQAVRALWPLVEQGLARPATCTNCGAPLSTRQRRTSESAVCASCGVVNQTTPEAAVALYYSVAPDIYATYATSDHRARVTAHRQAWENQRAEIQQRTGQWQDEPIESLRHWEQLERAHWTAYAQAKSQIEPHDEAGFIESRMKFFYDEMARNEVWRAAHGMSPTQAQIQVNLAQLPDDVVDWGPLRPEQVEENYFHQSLLSSLETEPELYTKMLQQLGYRDATHRALVDRTFSQHYAHQAGQPWFQQAVTAGALRAAQEHGAVMADANSDLLAPIEGVTLEVYAQVSAKQGSGASAGEILQFLAQHQLDRETFDRASKGWIERMSQDTTGAIGTAYSKAFMGGGQYGAAGAAAASNLGAGGMATAGGAEGPEPVSFETYAEISGAMGAWSQQGKDVSAMLEQHFQMSATDMSNISMYWSTKMMSDLSLMERLGGLTSHYEQVWLSRP